MKRSGFARPAYVRKLLPAPSKVRGKARPEFAGKVRSYPKDELVRSEPYRRLVADLPCKACGIQGYSQAAHVPASGKGIKQDDRETFALCCARVGINGCHADYDQYRMFPSSAVAREIGRAWAADTRRQISAAGRWPPKLPTFNDKVQNV